MNEGVFNKNELTKLDERDYVILASGGPLMQILCEFDDGTALCDWPDGTAIFPLACLRKTVRLGSEGQSKH